MPSVARSFTTIAVAKRLGVSLQTVQRWVDAGHLRAWKTPGGHRRIEAASAEALFKAHEEGVGLAPVAGAAAAIHAPSVVIVEDDPAAATLLETLVHKALPQARVVVAENGFQGLIVIGRLSPQVVITDISMPYMNGHQLMHSLMAEPGMRPRLLIAVTALTPDELAAQGSLPQGVRLFSKPVPRDPFVAELRKVA